MDHQRLDGEPAFARGDDFAADGIQVVIVHICPLSVDLQPRPAVEDALAPAPDLADLTRPADVAQCLRVEVPSVVDREVPVAVGSVRPLGSRSAESDRLHCRQLS